MSTDLLLTPTSRAHALRSHWRFLFWEGVVLAVLGLLAVLVPWVASITVALVIGWLLLISGLAGLVSTIRMRAAPGFGFSLLSALTAIIAGGCLVAFPLSGVVSLTVILTVFLAVEGTVSILYALQHRESRRWGFLAFSGVIDLVLAGMIFAGLPGSAGWAIGLLVGINLLLGGVALVSMALAARAHI